MNIPELKCSFCKLPCLAIDGTGYNRFGKPKFWECHNHKNIVQYLPHHDYDFSAPPDMEKGDIFHTNIDIRYKNIVYSVHWCIANERWPQNFSISKCNPNGKGERVIFEMEEYPPNVTPDNIESKLPLWLTFW